MARMVRIDRTQAAKKHIEPTSPMMKSYMLLTPPPSLPIRQSLWLVVSKKALHLQHAHTLSVSLYLSLSLINMFWASFTDLEYSVYLDFGSL